MRTPPSRSQSPTRRPSRPHPAASQRARSPPRALPPVARARVWPGASGVRPLQTRPTPSRSLRPTRRPSRTTNRGRRNASLRPPWRPPRPLLPPRPRLAPGRWGATRQRPRISWEHRCACASHPPRPPPRPSPHPSLPRSLRPAMRACPRPRRQRPRTRGWRSPTRFSPRPPPQRCLRRIPRPRRLPLPAESAGAITAASSAAALACCRRTTTRWSCSRALARTVRAREGVPGWAGPVTSGAFVVRPEVGGIGWHI
mmetsp:Transcript_72806/g.175643  ORF Transcript_72806/g.175643 Transcript_72806/m.175643 type:complete len:256 (+) Transcript_72806:1017-1784(+)